MKALRLVKLAGGRTPPKAFLLIPYGRVETTKGTFLFSREDAEELMEERAEHAADINIDYEHGALKTDGAPAPAAGWCRLELRDDGLWAVDVRWTDKAAAMLSAGEYRYFSPAYAVDPKTKRIKEFINLALTNLPATKDIRPLVAAGRLTHKEKHMAFKDQIKKHMSDKKLDAKKLAEDFAMSVERLKKLMDGDEPTEEEMKTCTKAMGLEGLENLDEENDDSPEEEEVAARRGRADELDLVALTGHRDPKKQAQELAKMRLAQEKVDTIEKEFKAMRRKQDEEKRASLITQGKADGKLTPPLIRFWATRSVAELEEFLASAPEVQGREVAHVDPSSPLAVLSREELAMCSDNDEDPKELAAFKKAEAAGENRQRILNSYHAVAE